jgi:hypothetical protein
MSREPISTRGQDGSVPPPARYDGFDYAYLDRLVADADAGRVQIPGQLPEPEQGLSFIAAGREELAALSAMTGKLVRNISSAPFLNSEPPAGITATGGGVWITSSNPGTGQGGSPRSAPRSARCSASSRASAARAAAVPQSAAGPASPRSPGPAR